jgi:hypothetical protein
MKSFSVFAGTVVSGAHGGSSGSRRKRRSDIGGSIVTPDLEDIGSSALLGVDPELERRELFN